MNCGDPTTNLTQLKMLVKTGSPLMNTLFLANASVLCGNGFKYSDNSGLQFINCLAPDSWNFPSIAFLAIFLSIEIFSVFI